MGSSAPRRKPHSSLRGPGGGTVSQSIHASSGPAVLNASQAASAVQQNRRWVGRLSWGRVRNQVAIYFLRFADSPTEAEFAQAVARWQMAVGRGLRPTGVLDVRTWRVMRPRGEPARFAITTPYGRVVRPRNHAEVLATFGNPAVNHRAWKRANIVRIRAPSGHHFQTLTAGARSYLWGHRKLKPHFEHLFQQATRAGIWDLLQPVSGPYAFRPVRGGRRLSTHAFGISIDIRPNLYPRGQARRWPDPRLVSLFRDHGFHWGMFWRTPDPHHFQFATGT